MVNDGIVLGHKVSAASIEVDRGKIEVMTGLPAPTNVKDVRSFRRHAEFYRRFIQDFRNTQNKNTKILEIIHKLYIYTRFIYIYLFTVIKEMFIFMFIFS